MAKSTFLTHSFALTPLAFACSVNAIDSVPLELEEMMVISERISKSLQQTPVSAHVVEGETLDALKVPNLSELSNTIPNLFVGEGTNTTNIHIRGTGSGTNRGFEQSVAMYIDEVYMGRDRQYRLSFVDLEQVEVFRGPQGVLFGKNAVAGAISLTTRKAEAGKEFTANLIADYEPEYNDRAATIVLASGLGDRAGLRFVHKSRKTDGFLYNTAMDRTEPALDDQTSRLSAVVELTDHWQLNGKYEISQNHTLGSSSQTRTIAPISDISRGLVESAFRHDPDFDSEINDRKSEDNLGYEGFRKNDAENAVLSLHGKYDSGEWFYNLGYSHYETNDQIDADFTPTPLVGINEQQDFSQYSQELRFRSSFDGALNFHGGIYWQRNDLDLQVREDLSLPDIPGYNEAVFDFFGIDRTATPPTPSTRHMDFQTDNELTSIFAEVEIALNDEWSLELGGRQVWEEKEGTRLSNYETFQQPNVPGNLASIKTVGVYGLSITMPEYQGTINESNFTPSAKLLFAPNDLHNFYGKYEEAVKAGGFNANNDASEDNQIFDEERAQSIELGWKANLLDNRLTVNTAAFYTEIDDLQVNVLNGVRFLTDNAVKSINQGIETDGRWQISEHLQLSGYLAWLDAFYDDYTQGPCSAEILAQDRSARCDLTGKDTPFAPEWSVGLGANYIRDITPELTFSSDLNIGYSTDYLLNFDADPIDNQPAFTRVDAQVALSAQHWQLALVGRNLTDENIYSYSFDATATLDGVHSVYSQMPRTVMLSAQLKF